MSLTLAIVISVLVAEAIVAAPGIIMVTVGGDNWRGFWIYEAIIHAFMVVFAVVVIGLNAVWSNVTVGV